MQRSPGERAGLGLEERRDEERVRRQLDPLDAGVRRAGGDHHAGRLEPRDEALGEPVAAPVEARERLAAADLGQ